MHGLPQLAVAAGVLLAACAFGHAQAQEAGNLLGDPFEQATGGMAGCPVPRGPYVTPEVVRRETHVRTQRGGSCFRVGRCRLPNSYMYDKEIVPRVSLYIREDGRFADTSVWVLGQARYVFLTGCVRTKAQSEALERSVGLVDDVLGVVNQLMVGTQGKPAHRLVGDTTPDD